MSSSIFLKLFEYCLLIKLDPYIKLNDRQHGFRKNYSTATACFVLKETVLNYTNADSRVYSCFLDISKAFDSINHNILFNKLHQMGIPHYLIDVMRFWYRNQNVRVKYRDAFSDEWKLMNGVRQGGVLSGLLFSIYINALIDRVSETNMGCMLGISRSNIIAYADDIVILAPSRQALQFLLNICFTEAIALGLEFNCQKNKIMVFHPSSRRVLTKLATHFMIGGSYIEEVESVKYLGFIIRKDLKDDDDIDRALKKFYMEFNQILRKFHFTEKSIKIFLFKQYCMQIYGAELWFGSKSKRLLKQFEVGFHKAIKKLLGLSSHESNHYACQEASLLMFDHFINKLKICATIRFFKKPCRFIEKIIPYLNVSSKLLNDVLSILESVYDCDSLFDNDLMALTSRIHFTQNHEEQLRTSW